MNIENMKTENQCICCGMCQTICPVSAITMEYVEREGFIYPSIATELCVDCGQCLKFCPANMTDTSKQTLLGEYKGLYLAHSCVDKVRKQSTSGGVVNSLVRFLIDENVVKSVMLTGYSEKSPIEATTYIINKENVHLLLDDPRNFASRYVIVPVLENLKEIIKTDGKIAVVGTPCQIKALNLGGVDYRDKILKIGIACSGGMSYKATEQYKKSQNLPRARIYYRGDGWPGKNSLVLNDGFVLEFPHLKSLFEQMYNSQIFINPGCRRCDDQFAEKADISFCDFWNDEEKRTEAVGNSCVITRSQWGQDILEGMVHKKYVQVVRELSIDEVVDTQLAVLKSKKGNLKEKCSYQIFTAITDWIYKYRIYRWFSYFSYHLIRALYCRMRDKAQI